MSDVILPYPHPGQIAVRRQARRFNWLSAGRRWRKTTLAMAITVEAAMVGGTYIWGAPTFDQVRTGYEEVERAAGRVADFNKSTMSATFPKAGRILFRSLDNPQNARSKTADGIVIDEAGDVKEAAWYEVLRPMLIDTGGWAWGIGTPRGYNWFWKEHRNAIDRPDTMAWQVPTLGVRIDNGTLIREPHPLENPDIPFSELVDAYASTPETLFRQEYLADFVDMTGGVFRNVTFVSTAQVQPPQPNAQYIWGIDWAFSNDFTVVSIMDALTMTQVYIDRYNGVDYTMQRERIAALATRYKPSAIIAEVNSMGRPNNEQLRAAGLPVRDFVTANASKAEIIEKLAGQIERGAITLLADPVQIGELQAYEGKQTTSGATRYSAPEGMHDDTVMALALAVHGAGRSGGIFI